MDEAEKLKKRIKELEEEVKRLRKIEKEFEEFKVKHTQTVTELRKALKIKTNITETAKPVGAQNGHKAYTRRIPERIDSIQEHNPGRCPECNTKLGATQEIRQRYVTDIKLVAKVKNRNKGAISYLTLKNVDLPPRERIYSEKDEIKEDDGEEKPEPTKKPKSKTTKSKKKEKKSDSESDNEK